LFRSMEQFRKNRRLPCVEWGCTLDEKYRQVEMSYVVLMVVSHRLCIIMNGECVCVFFFYYKYLFDNMLYYIVILHVLVFI
jgi:hypothetical protein